MRKASLPFRIQAWREAWGLPYCRLKWEIPAQGLIVYIDKLCQSLNMYTPEVQR